jgi:hypothetical protein
MSSAQNYVLSDLSVILMIGVPLLMAFLLWLEGRGDE